MSWISLIPRSKPPRRRRFKARRGRIVDEAYCEWMRDTQPCMVTGRRPVTLHHVRRYGEPKDDRRIVPLIPSLHMLTDEIPGLPCVERGKQVFESFWCVNLEASIVRYNLEYEAIRGRRAA